MSKEIKEKITRILPLIEKPLRYTGGELNSSAPQKDGIRVLLAFPDLYEIGISNGGLAILYNIINNNIDSASAERAYAPWTDMEEIMRSEKIPLYGLESMDPASEFDIIGFTLQYELSYTNVVNMISLAGVSPDRKERKNSDPLIIAGGPCVSNPMPLSGIIDLFCLGDSEELINDIIEKYNELKNNSADRGRIIEELSGIEGVFSPLVSKKARFRKIADLRPLYYPKKPIVPTTEAVHNRVSIEIMRGCARGCRFCAAGTNYRPVRERSPEDILCNIKDNIKNTGYREATLLSLSSADYTCLRELGAMIKESPELQGLNISLPSLRVSPENLDLIQSLGSRKAGLTIAPEAGSERLRKVINKNISADDINNSVRTAFEKGWSLIKLYFMIGLPTEENEDIEELIELLYGINKIARSSGGRCRINVSISPFSPKPGTPFEREAMESPESIRGKCNYIVSSLKRAKRLRINYRDPEVTAMETVFARGGKELSEVLLKAVERRFSFDAWTEYFNYKKWNDIFGDCRIELHSYFQEISGNKSLPWDIIDQRIDRGWLEKESLKASKVRKTADCTIEACSGCGVCASGLKNTRSETSFEIRQEALSQIDNAVKNENQKFSFRVKFSKFDMGRFIPHKDFMGVLERAVLLSGLPILYSKGFHPHPKISFSAPLPMGYCSRAEYFDISFTKDQAPEKIFGANDYFPAGIQITAVEKIPASGPSILKEIKASDYSVKMPPVFETEKLIDDFLKSSEWPMERTSRKSGKKRTVDLKRLVIEMHNTVSENVVFMRLKTVNGVSGKPSEILREVFDVPEEEIPGIEIIRTEQYRTEKDQFVPFIKNREDSQK
ncbi:MAG: TIGR03936 family radical SAM-associated protein [Fibrobacterota bacterium]